MTTANKITVIRILMIPVFVTLAIYYGQSIQEGSPQDWQRFAAIAVFLLAAVSDGLDGYVARRYNQRSSLGMILDPIADKGLLLSGIITLSISNWSTGDQHYGKFPAWFPVLVITRDTVILVGQRGASYSERDGSRQAELDGKSGDGLADGGDRVGHVATPRAAVALCGGGRRIFHSRFRDDLRERRSAAVNCARTRQREVGLTRQRDRSHATKKHA